MADLAVADGDAKSIIDMADLAVADGNAKSSCGQGTW
jgi:hypothetical protein